MLNERTVSVANGYWAAHFGCSPHKFFTEPFRILIHGTELSDYGGVFALFRGGAVVASLPRERADTLSGLLAAQAHGCTPRSFALALDSVATEVIGPAYIGYAAAVSLPAHPARALGPRDNVALLELQQACDEIEWEHGGSSIEHPSSGVFVRERLVAVAGYEVWGSTIAHISVVTHPDFRSHGFGRSAVAHLAERAILAGLLPQYRTLESNRASLRLAESLGFHSYATSTAVRLSGSA